MTNKFIRYLLRLLYVIIAIGFANAAKNTLTDQQIRNVYQMPGMTQVFLPSELQNQGKFEEVMTLIKGVSVDTKTPFVFRVSSAGYKQVGEGKVDAAQLMNTITFVETNFSYRKPTVIVSHGIETQFLTTGFSALTYDKLQGSDLFYKKDSNSEKVLATLTAQINQKFGLSLKPDALLKVPNRRQNIQFQLTNTDWGIFIGISIIFYFVFLFVWLSENSQKIAIYRLNGLSNLKISNLIFNKELMILTGTVFTLLSIFYLQTLDFQFVLQSLALFVITSLVSYLAVELVSRRSINSQISHRRFFKNSHVFLYLIKILIFIVSINSNMGLVSIANSSVGGQSNSGLHNYATLYPISLGYNVYQSGPLIPTHLFEALENEGVIFSNIGSGQAPSAFQGSKTVQVNANFLEKNQILGSNNQPIKVTESETHGVVLVSEDLSNELSSIEKTYYQAAQNDLHYFKSSTIDFYLIKDGQKLSIPNNGDGTNIVPNALNSVSPKIVEVYTAQNAGKDLIFEAFNQNNPYSFLIPIQKSLETTYKELFPSIKADNVQGNYTSLIRADEVPKVSQLMLVGNWPEFIFGNLFTFILVMSMVVATTSFYFKISKRRISIERLQGISKWRSYRRLFGGIILLYLASYGLVLFEGNNWIVGELFALYLVLELLLTLFLLRDLEHHSLLDTLKGE